jgi:hypothetical protein
VTEKDAIRISHAAMLSHAADALKQATRNAARASAAGQPAVTRNFRPSEHRKALIGVGLRLSVPGIMQRKMSGNVRFPLGGSPGLLPLSFVTAVAISSSVKVRPALVCLLRRRSPGPSGSHGRCFVAASLA